MAMASCDVKQSMEKQVSPAKMKASRLKAMILSKRAKK